MAAISRNASRSSEKLSSYQQLKFSQNNHRSGDRISLLYPGVNEDITPLPRYWNGKEKYSTITLSQNNLRVHFKEPKNNVKTTEKDATSVQANHPIPAVCGLYYFEVKIVSKGRDGYIGIGLSAAGVSAARLPGWDKFSYGYHGDDGHIFCATGSGQPYGPTFTTGDVVGCGVNYIDGVCFYTKNGHNLGIAFHDVPLNLYPTVGLQTPGEIIDANFGQEPFVYKIENDILEMEQKTFNTIRSYPMPSDLNLYDQLLPKYVSNYLIHQGYCSTAEAFSRATNEKLSGDFAAAHIRQKIINLILSGQISKAIEMTTLYYPGLFESNENLLFLLKCRQFIEMINGMDAEYKASKLSRRQAVDAESQIKKPLLSSFSVSKTTGLDTNSPIHTSVIQMNRSCNKLFSTEESSEASSNAAIDIDGGGDGDGDGGDGDDRNDPAANNFFAGNINQSFVADQSVSNNSYDMDISDDVQNGNFEVSNADADTSCHTLGTENGNSYENTSDNVNSNGNNNGNGDSIETVQEAPKNANSNTSDRSDEEESQNKSRIRQILQFGRELYRMNQKLRHSHGANETNEKVLQDAFSLMAYSDPRRSPVGWQLDPKQRQSICDHLNSAILEASKRPKRPSLEIVVEQAQELVKLMVHSNMSCSAYLNKFDPLLTYS